jgi:hypothetical protein
MVMRMHYPCCYCDVGARISQRLSGKNGESCAHPNLLARNIANYGSNSLRTLRLVGGVGFALVSNLVIYSLYLYYTHLIFKALKSTLIQIMSAVPIIPKFHTSLSIRFTLHARNGTSMVFSASTTCPLLLPSTPFHFYSFYYLSTSTPFYNLHFYSFLQPPLLLLSLLFHNIEQTSTSSVHNNILLQYKYTFRIIYWVSRMRY